MGQNLTEEADGVAQLAAPQPSWLGVQLLEALHDVPVADVTVPHVTLQARAPEGAEQQVEAAALTGLLT